MRSALRIAVGIALILVGLLGLLVPIMPGWVPILIGIALLGPRTRLAKWLRRTFVRLKAKCSRRKVKARAEKESGPKGP